VVLCLHAASDVSSCWQSSGHLKRDVPPSGGRRFFQNDRSRSLVGVHLMDDSQQMQNQEERLRIETKL
jgi:hypothetical protein